LSEKITQAKHFSSYMLLSHLVTAIAFVILGAGSSMFGLAAIVMIGICIDCRIITLVKYSRVQTFFLKN